MIVTDRLRADALGAYGNPVAPTGRRQVDFERLLLPLVVVLERAHVHDAALFGLSRLGLTRLPGAPLVADRLEIDHAVPTALPRTPPGDLSAVVPRRPTLCG